MKMKKINSKLIWLTQLSLVCCPLNAMAASINGQIYTGVAAGRSLMHTTDWYRPTPGWEITQPSMSEFVDSYGAFLGYAFASYPIRVDASYQQFGNTSFKWHDTWLNQKGGSNHQSAGKVETDAYFVNAYWDIRNPSPWVPYIGGGVGQANHTMQYDFGPIPGTHDNSFSSNGPEKHDAHNFAWRLAVGLDYEATPHWRWGGDISYADLGPVTFKETGCAPSMDIQPIARTNHFTATTFEVHAVYLF